MARFKKSNHTITPHTDADVDFETNQDMGGNRITNAQDAVLNHDYVTRQQLNTHTHPYVLDHDHPYSPSDHEHGTLRNNLSTNGWQEMPDNMYLQWGTTSAFTVKDADSDNPGTGFPEGTETVTFNTMSGIHGSAGFPNDCIHFSFLIKNGANDMGTFQANVWDGLSWTQRNEMRISDYLNTGVYSYNKSSAIVRWVRTLTSPSYWQYSWQKVTYMGPYSHPNYPDTYEGPNSARIMWQAIGY
jgi:hypothetical protein